LTPSTAQSIQRTRGKQTRRSGAAAFTTGGALPRLLHRGPCLHQCPCLSQHPSRLRRCPSCRQFSRSRRRGLQIRTIAPTASQIGRRAGQFRRRSGAAGFTARAAPTREVDVRRRRSHTTAMQDSPIGKRAGVLPRRLGAVPTRARVALQQLEGALELRLNDRLDSDAGPVGHLPVSLAGAAPAIVLPTLAQDHSAGARAIFRR